MKCNSCKYYWHYSPDYTSPYGEDACMKDESNPQDLYNEDINVCEFYEPKSKSNKYYDNIIQDIKNYNKM